MIIQVYALKRKTEEAQNGSMKTSSPFRSNTPKRCPFHYRGLECENRKLRNIWTDRQIWPWSTEWSRAKANGALPRECAGHSKHPLPTTQEKPPSSLAKILPWSVRPYMTWPLPTSSDLSTNTFPIAHSTSTSHPVLSSHASSSIKGNIISCPKFPETSL